MRTPEKALLDVYGTHMDDTHTKAFMAGWKAALDAVLSKLPGGEICDPQVIADEIRELLK